MNVLRSERHLIYGQHLNNVSLFPYESKLFIAENGVGTLACGPREAVWAHFSAVEHYPADASIRRHHKQILPDKTPWRPINQVIEHRFIRLSGLEI